MTASIETDPDRLAAIFSEDRATHIYGLPDLEEPFWSSSTWFRSGSAIVGIVSTGSDWVTGYAMSQSYPEETLRLLLEVHEHLPPGTWITGPLGLGDAISKTRESRSKGIHHRMILGEAVREEPCTGIVELGSSDLERLIELRDTDREGMFFLPMMLSRGVFVGVEQLGSLIAAAGTHVASDKYSIAAVGSVITHPNHRGRGLGRRVVSALCRRLRPRFRTIGLNVAASNTPAHRVYESVGFRKAFDYEEVQVL